VAKLGLTWWENERKDRQAELNKLLGDLGKLKEVSKQKQTKEPQKKPKA
jgi:hypothetical protein